MMIGLVGEKLAGKDEAAAYLQKKYGAFYVKYSHILDEILGMLDLPISRRNEIDLGRALRDTFKRNVLWGGIAKRLERSTANIKVVGSIRLEDEFELAKKLGAKIVYITAPIELRHQRLMEARREKAEDGKQSFEDFVKQEREWTEKGIPALGAKADFRIENTGSLEDLYGKVDIIVEELK